MSHMAYGRCLVICFNCLAHGSSIGLLGLWKRFQASFQDGLMDGEVLMSEDLRDIFHMTYGGCLDKFLRLL